MPSSSVAIRRAALPDLDFLLAVDLLADGYTVNPDEKPLNAQEKTEYRQWLAIFVTEPAEAGWIAEDALSGQRVGMILARFRDRYHEPSNETNQFLFQFLEPTIFPADGRFCEIFNLWVDPAYRRQGLATRLKLAVESETRRRGIKMIYTHTEAANGHVIVLNQKLGYQMVRSGPLWDEVPRVSLVKWLETQGGNP